MGTNQPASLDKMVWVDLETTGLSSDLDVILEIGVTITNVEGLIIDSTSSLVNNDGMSSQLVERGDPYVKDMHTKSGLLDELRQMESRTYRYPDEAEVRKPGAVANAIRTWLEGQGLEAGVYPMCGSTINFDRAFLERHMPLLFSWFHYRNVDVTSIKMVCSMVNPTVYAGKPEHVSTHRALRDIDDTVDEYIFYLDNFLHVYLPVERPAKMKLEISIPK